MADTRRYIIILELGDFSVERLTTLVPALQNVLNNLSKDPIEQVFRSISADNLAYAVRTYLKAHQIRVALEAPARSTTRISVEPFLSNRDHLMIVELGDDHSDGAGFTRFGTWLQHH